MKQKENGRRCEERRKGSDCVPHHPDPFDSLREILLILPFLSADGFDIILSKSKKCADLNLPVLKNGSWPRPCFRTGTSSLRYLDLSA